VHLVREVVKTGTYVLLKLSNCVVWTVFNGLLLQLDVSWILTCNALFCEKKLE